MSDVKEQLKRKIDKYKKYYEKYGTDEYKDKYKEYVNKYFAYKKKYPSSSTPNPSLYRDIPFSSPLFRGNRIEDYDHEDPIRQKRIEQRFREDEDSQINKSLERYSFNRDSIREELRDKYFNKSLDRYKKYETDEDKYSIKYPSRKRIRSSWWQKNKFKCIVFFCLFCILALYGYNRYYKKEGSWSLEYEYKKTEPKKITYVSQSKGELECRRILEKLFKRAFPSLRPAFLMNVVTGKPLEIDCCNLELRLGVEYNGKQHYQYTPGMHRNFEAFRLQQYRDEMKMKLCRENRFNLITVPYTIPIKSIENYLIEQLRYHGYDPDVY